jgi:hypothetical protein
MLHVMSFEEEKSRLIQELADAQAETRAKYGMKPKSESVPSKDSKDKASTQDDKTKS